MADNGGVENDFFHAASTLFEPQPVWLRTRNAPSNLVCWLEGLTSMRSSGLEPGSRASAEIRVHDSMPFSHFTRFVVLYACHFDSGWVGPSKIPSLPLYLH